MSLDIRRLADQGFSRQQIAETYNLTIDDVNSILEAQPVSLEEAIEAAKPAALRTVLDIAQFGENEAAKLKAAQYILDKQTRGPAATDKWGSYLEKMKRVMERHELASVASQRPIEV